MNNINDIQLSGKRIFCREDFNVPLTAGTIRDTTRIDAALPTIHQLMQANCQVLIVSHLGRPTPGRFDPELSLAPVAQYLQQVLPYRVDFEPNWLDGIDWHDKNIVIAENVRFLEGEKSNDAGLAAQMAAGFDVFVMDAFACAHRQHASTFGVADYVPQTCAGPLFCREIEAIDAAIAHPNRPFVAIIGGAKVSTKIVLLEQLLSKVDTLIVGGGIANTFLAAAGHPVGDSLVEHDFIPAAQKLLQQYGEKIPLPTDVVTAPDMQAQGCTKSLDQVIDDDKIFDIGPKTSQHYESLIATAETIIWNGPVGVFEVDAFANGTRALAHAVADSKAYSLIGGGDTIAAVNQYQVMDQMSVISTGGGAFLSYLEQGTLPVISVLDKDNVHEATN